MDMLRFLLGGIGDIALTRGWLFIAMSEPVLEVSRMC
jgi:hypothetical protein